jgi:uncharacterized protein (DUF58 family)
VNSSSRLPYYLLVVGLCLLLFGRTGRLEMLAFGAPFAVTIFRHRAVRDGGVECRRSIDTREVYEGDPIGLEVSISAHMKMSLVEVLTPIPSNATIFSGANHFVTALHAGETRTFRCVFALARRRVCVVPPTVVRSLVSEEEYGASVEVTVFPDPFPLRSEVRPEHTQVYTGNFPSKRAGEGIEFASVAPFAPGDRLSAINWRATARRGSLQGNRYVVERNADIVLLIDTFADAVVLSAGDSGSVSVLDLEARCAAAVAHRYLREKNRLALVELGHVLSFLPPASSRNHFYRVLDRLSRISAVPREITAEVASVPKRVLPSSALVIAVSGFVSEHFDHALLDLASRGFDVAVVRVPYDERFLDGEEPGIATAAEGIRRLSESFRLRRLVSAGIAVASFHPGKPLDATFRELGARRARRV